MTPAKDETTTAKADADTETTTKTASPKAESTQTKAAPTPAPSDEPRSPDEIKADIEDTREDLGDTAAALAAKADVKAQAQSKVDDMKQTVSDKKDEFTAKAKAKASQAQDATPESVGAGASQAASVAQENPVPLALAGAFLGGVVVGWILSR